MSNDETRGTGRRHRTRAEAEQLATEYEASGLTQQQYAERHGIALKTLARYVARHRRAKARDVAPARLLPVELSTKSEVGGGLTVLLAGGRRIEVKRGFDAVILRQLVNALERH
jgi:hypothetical protein